MPADDAAEYDDKAFLTGFERDNIMSDAFYLAGGLVDAAAIQTFLENLPYDERSRADAAGPMGRRSWLADFTVDGKRVSEHFAELGVEHGINPIILVARLQGEQSLVLPSSRPSQSRIDKGFGCGCPDGGSCSGAYSGFAAQIECAYAIHALSFRRSQGLAPRYDWNMGQTTRSLDGFSVTPVNHATAALYLYTPHVYFDGGGTDCLGGACIIYGISKLYLERFQHLGLVPEDVTLHSDPVSGGVSMSGTQAGHLRGAAYYTYAFGILWSRISNASVSVRETSASPSFDTRGHWDIELPDGSYTLDVTAPGYSPASATCQSGGSFCWVKLERDPNASTEPPPMSTMPGVGITCGSGARTGSCIDTTVQMCGGTIARGICPGGSAVTCCLTESTAAGVGVECTDGSRSGACIDTGVHRCDGTLRSGLCSGGADVRCCLR